MDIDPARLQAYWSRLITITDEAALGLGRTAFSTIVRESNDYACNLLDPDANALAQNRASVVLFTGIFSRTLKHMLRRFPRETWAPGDVVITNDPWAAAGHLPDVAVASPIFHRGTLVAFAGSIAHAPDIGGVGFAADARELVEEGLFIPPSHLFHQGVLNEELVELIRRNVRVPDEVVGDLFAQVGAGDICRRRLLDFLGEERLADLSGIGALIQDRSEAAMRRAIADIPDGVYSREIKTDGIEEPLTIRVTLTIQGSALRADYAGTSPQVRRGINSVMNCTYAYTCYAIKCVLDPHTPRNEGSYRPIEVCAPEGTLVNPRFPAPVSGRTLTFHYLPAPVFGALAQAIPDRVLADCGSPSNRTVVRGTRPDGRPFAVVLLTSGGMGAGADRDGLSATPFPANTGFPSAEVVEGAIPIRVLEKELRTDSGGAGKYRGGCGQRIRLEVLREGTVVSLITDRIVHPPLGFFGGRSGAPAAVFVEGKGPIDPKGRTELRVGDVLVIETPGGGGYGEPQERDRVALRQDLRDALVSWEEAASVYGLADRSLSNVQESHGISRH